MYVFVRVRSSVICQPRSAVKETVTLEVDWGALQGPCKLASTSKALNAPAIEGFQPARDFGVVTGKLPPIEVEAEKGWLLVLQC